ncbi:hypothetical protein [Mycolicibacterium aubagnense]|nr:hypothetical protein [Mycolicibacterium aubagnense]
MTVVLRHAVQQINAWASDRLRAIADLTARAAMAVTHILPYTHTG